VEKRVRSVSSIGIRCGGLLTVNMRQGKVYYSPVVAYIRYRGNAFTKPLRSNDRRGYTFRHMD
jgi:hypothetical protein